jgi:hypothetical protein
MFIVSIGHANRGRMMPAVGNSTRHSHCIASLDCFSMIFDESEFRVVTILLN